MRVPYSLRIAAAALAAGGLVAWGAHQGEALSAAPGAPTRALNGTAAEQTALRDLYAQALAAGERDVVFYQAATDSEWQRVWIAFSQAFPGIRVTYMHVSPQGVTERLDIEKATGAHYADIVSQPVNVIQAIADKGYLQAYSPPTASGLPERFRDPQARVHYAYSKVFGLAYNSRRTAAAEAPRTLDQLLSPGLKNQFEYVSPGGGAGTTDVAIVTLRERGLLSREQLQALRDLGRSGGGPESSITALAQGRIAYNAWAYLAPLARQRQQGAPVDIRFDPELSLLVPFGQGVVKAPAHPHAARLLLAWLLTPDAQALLAKEAFALGTMPGAPSPAGFPTDPELRRLYEPPPPPRAAALLAQATPELKAIWQSPQRPKPQS